MKITRTFLIMQACILTILSACGSIPKSLRTSFTYCYDGQYTGLDTLINIDGYYTEVFFDREFSTTATYQYFMFYDNGLYVYGINDIYYDDRNKRHIKKDISSFLKDFSENIEAPGANYFYGNYWGNYIICGDTIKVQRVYKAMSLNDSWGVREVWYKIIDRNTILCINIINLPITFRPQPVKRERYPIAFTPIPVKPQPYNSWILKEKWFWRYERDWNVFMNSLEKSKRKKK